MKHNRHPRYVLTDTKSLADMLTPPDSQHKKCFAHRTCRYPVEYTDTEKHAKHGGGGHMGRHPLPLRGCPTYGSPLIPISHADTP